MNENFPTELFGRRVTLYAIYKGIGWKGKENGFDERRIFLGKISLHGDIIFDDFSFRCSEKWEKLDLKEGDEIIFDAKVTYEYPINHPEIKTPILSNPTKMVKILKGNQGIERFF